VVAASGTPAPRRKSQVRSQLLEAGASEHDIGQTDPQTVRKELNGFVKEIAQMVNLDWHDGYEEQGERLNDYFQAVSGPAQAVYNMTVLHHTGFDRCHEVMKVCPPPPFLIHSSLKAPNRSWRTLGSTWARFPFG